MQQLVRMGAARENEALAPVMGDHDHVHVKEVQQEKDGGSPSKGGRVDGVYTSDGSVNLRGEPSRRDKSGGWKACWFIFGNEVAERISSFGVLVNLVSYLTGVLHEPLPTAAQNVNNWAGTVFLTPILGAFVADAFLGRYWTIAVFSVFYVTGSVMLTVSAAVPSLRPPSCTPPGICIPASTRQKQFFYAGLYVMSLGTGGIKPCVVTLGADQFDEEHPVESIKKKSFFNWWYMAIGIGVVFSVTVLVYIQDNVGWSWGFGIPTVLLIISLVVFFVGTPFYRHKPAAGSPITQFARVVVASLRNWNVRVPKDPNLLYEVPERKGLDPGRRQLLHSNKFTFLDKAAIVTHGGKAGPWKLCTVTEVEECKLFVGMFPIWATNLMFQTVLAQTTTFFTKQGATMDRRLGKHFEIPPASLGIFSALAIVTVVPLYDRAFVPVMRRITGNPRGISLLTRMGIGIVLATVSMLVAGAVETKRLKAAADHGLLDQPGHRVPISIFWLVPQNVILGVADAFCIVAQMEFFYDQAPDHMKSLGSAAYNSINGVGNYLSSALLSRTRAITRKGNDPPWIVNNLNRSKLASYYYLIASISAVDFLLFLVCAHRYKYKKVESAKVDDVNGKHVAGIELKSIQ